MNKILSAIILISFFILQHTVIAVETAPRISDREIIESLAEIRGNLKRLDEKLDTVDKSLNKRIDDLDSNLNKRIDDLDSNLNKRIDALDSKLNKRIDDLRTDINSRFEEVGNRFDTLQWTLGLFITIALVIFGFVLRMQWQMHRRQTQMETILETQREELSFIKKLIEKFQPPRGVL
ncbi:hypothetical protein KsCSTR_10400 [Candidatus Kuenenia stuttgartiensis]|uniref:t-SNARE coiled-coil homology domain-containing protein n=1 Tax=Kuenenia stuttgartiensis TaxID=174633 RepID=Q1PYQ3_KUEST|nr:DUF1640 domain-containing protein [Candidatus Kuenenia stuttgartiensis]QII10419.1 hypothetical protein KsCSTR_10400 [Candidatus Kuenenia stuttgartiensis]TVM01925.1 MAG: hypothetical protein CV080_02810 [Candidatus Kuenenia stuttgartiensis]GJQ49492.1 MAG: hypothetical protein HKUEN01_18780 [Candidatus Kuenenia stuttgartiensis]CAJ72218.1 hypothetical protein kustd1473 [Candidatus Kuenenia stuttgartiensis]